MRIALCRPSASSQSVFQKTPGLRSTHGAGLTSTNTLTDGVITGGLSGDTSAGLAQRLLDRFPERLDRQGAFDLAPVDEERGRGPHAGLAALALISQDRILEARGVEALRERLGVEPQPTRVAQQVLAREVGLGKEQQVVVLPVPPLRARAAGGHRRWHRAVVRPQREVLERDPDLVRELGVQPTHHPLGLPAERTLIVAPL